MKQYILKATGTAAILGLLATGSFAQDLKQDTKVETTTTIRRDNNDVIIIKPKTDVATKLTIEIKGEDVKVNGKPLSEYKSDDVIISTRKQLSVKREIEDEDDLAAPPPPPRTRFRSDGGVKVYSYDSDDNMASLNAKLNTLGGNKAFLGVGTENEGEGDGVTITSVSKESAAEKAGLKKGDVITKVNDSKINSPEELTKTIGKFNPDEKINIVYKRDKKEVKTTATLTKRKLNTTISYAPGAYEFKKFNFDNNNNFSYNLSWKPRLGLKAQETEDGKGLKVLDVDDESAAEKAGIKEGDIITSFDGTEVNNIDKLRELSKAALEKNTFKVKLTREGKEQELDVKIPKNLKSTNL